MPTLTGASVPPVDLLARISSTFLADAMAVFSAWRRAMRFLASRLLRMVSEKGSGLLARGWVGGWRACDTQIRKR